MVNHRVNDYNERSNRLRMRMPCFSIERSALGAGRRQWRHKNDRSGRRIRSAGQRQAAKARPISTKCGGISTGASPASSDARAAVRAAADPTTDVARASAWASSIGVLIAIYLGSGVFVVQDGQVGVVIAVRQVSLRPPVRACTGVCRIRSKPHEFVNVGQIRSVEVGRSNVVAQANVQRRVDAHARRRYRRRALRRAVPGAQCRPTISFRSTRSRPERDAGGAGGGARDRRRAQPERGPLQGPRNNARAVDRGDPAIPRSIRVRPCR